MAMMLTELYDALRSVDVPEEKARMAAEAVADFDRRQHDMRSDLNVLKALAGVMVVVQLALFWQAWNTRGAMEQRFANVEAKLAGIETRLSVTNPSVPR